ncbi:NAD-dependent epimerase/dehydratase family protein [Marinivivus vitaminiproducens]|uniref:NAD-dependent epimerase/dehydratase family protein n=1 Tax=Marinivivus vitaminiproducens TaxID=3035935 RepID=UPI0027A74FF5|nr:NAD-dependent epimerase/dehydratase family protein [Geminicoccaceae bacterium SCSIO 64248]
MAGLIAVTGATGFIGRRLVRSLKADPSVRLRLLLRRPDQAATFAEQASEVVPGGLDDAGALARLVDGADVVIHLAGAVAARSRRAFFAINADATARLAGLAARRPRPPRFLLVSSLAARAPDLSAYAASKQAAEQAVAEAGGGLAWTIVRPPAVYGPGDRATLPFFRAASRGFVPILGRGDGRFSTLFVDDLAAAIATFTDESALDGRTVEIDDGAARGHDWPDMAQAAGDAVGRNVRAIPVPGVALLAAAAAAEAWRLLPLRPPVLSFGKMRELRHPDWVVRPGDLFDRTAWRPHVGLTSGMAETARWYRSNGWL